MCWRERKGERRVAYIFIEAGGGDVVERKHFAQTERVSSLIVKGSLLNVPLLTYVPIKVLSGRQYSERAWRKAL